MELKTTTYIDENETAFLPLYRMEPSLHDLCSPPDEPALSSDEIEVEVSLVNGGQSTPKNDSLNYADNPPKVHIIKPLGLPRLMHNGVLGLLDEEKHEANIDNVSNFRYRSLEVLAELELANGKISPSSGSPANEIRLRSDPEVGTDCYAYDIRNLQKTGLTKISDDGNSLLLTSRGYKFIALLKTYPEEFKDAPSQKIWASPAFQVIEFFLQQAGVELDFDMSPDDLPEQTDWVLPPNNQNSLLSIVSGELGVSASSLLRRICVMREEKGYIETESLGYGLEHNRIINVRVLKKGLEFALFTQKGLREKERVLDEAEVEESQKLIDGCIHLAESLGEVSCAEQLRQLYDGKSLFELRQGEFKREQARLIKLHDELSSSFNFANSMPLAA